MSPDGYQGWANWETWNVALWIGNEEGLYRMARSFRISAAPYLAFVDYAGLGGGSTPDGAAWDSPDLDIDELNKMITED